MASLARDGGWATLVMDRHKFSVAYRHRLTNRILVSVEQAMCAFLLAILIHNTHNCPRKLI